jgi:hypothetical protein
MIDANRARLLRELEEMLLDPEVRCSPVKLGEFLADEFIEFGSSGTVFDKQAIIQSLGDEAAHGPAPTLTVQKFSAHPLSDHIVLLTYRLRRRDEAAESEVVTLRSSIWKFLDGRWQMIFHQGTRASSSGT